MLTAEPARPQKYPSVNREIKNTAKAKVVVICSGILNTSCIRMLMPKQRLSMHTNSSRSRRHILERPIVFLRKFASDYCIRIKAKIRITFRKEIQPHPEIRARLSSFVAPLIIASKASLFENLDCFKR